MPRCTKLEAREASCVRLLRQAAETLLFVQQPLLASRFEEQEIKALCLQAPLAAIQGRTALRYASCRSHGTPSVNLRSVRTNIGPGSKHFPFTEPIPGAGGQLENAAIEVEGSLCRGPDEHLRGRPWVGSPGLTVAVVTIRPWACLGSSMIFSECSSTEVFRAALRVG